MQPKTPKVDRATVSFPADLLEAAQDHCVESNRKFSNYIVELVRRDLTAAGKLGLDDAADIVRQARELATARGAAAVRAKLDELANEAVATEAGP